MSEIESEAQFEEFVEEAGIMDWLLDGSTPEAPAAEDTAEVAVEQPRDEHGRFLPKEPEAEEEAEEAPEPVEQPVAEEAPAEEEAPEGEPEDQVFEIDPEYADLLGKYGGDLNKALGALSHAQSKIGEQGSELGEIRQQLAQMAQMQQQILTRPQSFGPYESDIDEDPRALVFEALDRGDGDTMQAALKAWGEAEPFEAAQFLFALPQMMADIDPGPQAQAPTVGPTTDLQTEMARVVERHPDVDKFLPHVGEVAREFPTLRGTLENGTPVQKAQAFEELVLITKSRAALDTSSQARTRAVLKAQEEARRERAEAAVVSARETAGAGKESNVDEFHRLFREATGQPLEDE